MAKEDVFTAAFLGDGAALERLLHAEPSLAQAADPACDVVEVPPLHHAISGGNQRAIGLLLDHVSSPMRGGERALRGAAARSLPDAVTRLLALGADARGVGAGRWVLDPAVAPLLAAAGATVTDGDSRWIGASCTGNQGRQGQSGLRSGPVPRHGARVDNRQAGSGGTALHHAARAGSFRTITVLLGAGAIPTPATTKGPRPSTGWSARRAPSTGGRCAGSWVESDNPAPVETAVRPIPRTSRVLAAGSAVWPIHACDGHYDPVVRVHRRRLRVNVNVSSPGRGAGGTAAWMAPESLNILRRW